MPGVLQDQDSQDHSGKIQNDIHDAGPGLPGSLPEHEAAVDDLQHCHQVDPRQEAEEDLGQEGIVTQVPSLR